MIQVHGVDTSGRRVVARTLDRDQFLAWCAQLPAGCVIEMEACTSGHHWARKLRALGLNARLIAAHFVSPYRMEGVTTPGACWRASATSASNRPKSKEIGRAHV